MSESKSQLASYLMSEYGEMFPKMNLTSLPDPKTVQFIRILSEYQKQQETTGQYLGAKDTRGKVKELGQVELLRQVQEMKEKHNHEILNLQSLQELAFNQFMGEWQARLAEEEQNAFF